MGKHKNTAQDAILISFMESHPDFARGFIKGDRVTMEARWSELAAELNEKGPPIKNVKAWKKVWNDWKAVIRKKLATNRAEAIGTGGGPFNQQSLTPTEETVARISGIYTVVDGIEKSCSFGLTPEPIDVVEPDEAVPENTERNSPTPKRKRGEGSSMQSFMSSEINCLRLITEKVQSIANSADSIVQILRERNDEIKRHNLAVEAHNNGVLKIKAQKNEILLKELEIQKFQLDLARNIPNN